MSVAKALLLRKSFFFSFFVPAPDFWDACWALLHEAMELLRLWAATEGRSGKGVDPGADDAPTLLTVGGRRCLEGSGGTTCLP